MYNWSTDKDVMSYDFDNFDLKNVFVLFGWNNQACNLTEVSQANVTCYVTWWRFFGVKKRHLNHALAWAQVNWSTVLDTDFGFTCQRAVTGGCIHSTY